jgi:hypothetical protein
VEAIANGLTAVPPDQLISLSYEEFVSEPVERLADIAARCGLATSAGCLAELRRLSYPDHNESWRTQLDPVALATIERVQRDTLRRYGYG